MDKLKIANNIDEIVIASKNYVNQKLKHTRKDGLQDFAWGTVNIRIGKTDYSADVVIGNNGTRLYLYDVINLKEIIIKERRSNQQRYSQKKKMLNIVTPSNNSINQNYKNDNGNILNQDRVTDEDILYMLRTDDYYKDVKPCTRKQSLTLNMVDNRNLVRYRNEIDASFNGNMGEGQRILVGMPSELLIKHGVRNKPIYISQYVAMKVAYPDGYLKGKHNLGISVLKNLPYQLNNPIVITCNTSNQNDMNESVVVWTNWKTDNNESIIAVIRINKNGDVEIDNTIPTIFNANEKYADNLIDNQKNILYTKSNKSIKELLRRRRHMPKGETDDTLIKNSIYQNPQNDNGNILNQDRTYSYNELIKKPDMTVTKVRKDYRHLTVSKCIDVILSDLKKEKDVT